MLIAEAGPFVKVLVSKHVVEVWEYADMPLSGYRSESPERRERESEDVLEERRKNQRRSKWNFMRTVNATFDAGSKFITHTFRDGVLRDVTDVREANEYWRRYIGRLRYRYGSFQWAVVVEFQDLNDRGAVHYHMIANLPYIPEDELEQIWGGGWVWVNRIDHVDNVGAYVVKYMAADMNDVRLCGLKAWRTSRNVKKPLELRGDAARDFLKVYDCRHLRVRVSTQYMSDYHGVIKYTQYNLMDKPADI